MKPWEIMKAYDDGATILARGVYTPASINNAGWKICNKPTWNWSEYEYKVKPEALNVNGMPPGYPLKTDTRDNLIFLFEDKNGVRVFDADSREYLYVDSKELDYSSGAMRP